MEIKEILDAICGRDENGDSKAQIGCYLYRYSQDNPEDTKDLGSATTYIPEIHVYPNRDYVMIDLTFLSEADTDFHKMNKLLQRRLEEETNEQYGYMIVFNVLPADVGNDLGYFEFINPVMFCITPLAPMKPANTLRMVVENDNLSFYESTDVDTVKTDLEVEYELRKREEAERALEQRKNKSNEQSTYLDELRRKNREM